jgi:hypothetical protein
MISVVPVKEGNIEEFSKVATTFDPRILDECPDVQSALYKAVDESTSSWVCTDGKRIFVLCGVFPHKEGSAFFWLMSDGDLESCRYSFLKQTRIFFNRLLEDYTYIVAVVNTEHEKSIKWLRWLGFEIVPEALPYAHGRATYYNAWIKGALWTQLVSE